MNIQLKNSFLGRDDHLLQAAWLSSFSHKQNKMHLRKSPLYTYNIKAKKYLTEFCSNIMLSENMIENHIDDLYALPIEDKIQKIIKNEFSDLGLYLQELINLFHSKELTSTEDIIDFFIMFISLLDCRNKITLFDNALKLKRDFDLCMDEIYKDNDLKTHIESKDIKLFDSTNSLDLLFLSNCLIKTRYEKTKTNISFMKQPVLRSISIINRSENELAFNGLKLIGENPVMRIKDFSPSEILDVKQMALDKSKNPELILLYWDYFSSAYIFPLNWNNIIFLHEGEFLSIICQDDYNEIVQIIIDLYETFQILGSSRDLIINPSLNNNLILEQHILQIKQKTIQYSDNIENIYRQFKKIFK